jgi:hypothetical protein
MAWVFFRKSVLKSNFTYHSNMKKNILIALFFLITPKIYSQVKLVLKLCRNILSSKKRSILHLCFRVNYQW